ncbi:probable metallo-beta-lactamase domain protein [Ramularia collo-cygni]|uniref:Probable metallo-beta-lactamase domain protein n=1 Tax=Ramularia collo-cygni TaxID=112498 RepID=A0A2D3V640_9PEZI|nr:probable metallo-beta-lactamase domain protein [Ramularia collo-cygni]CZT20177.1 probable metallo-beta-lactamase domain protein [Ramularia collo-cygni]
MAAQLPHLPDVERISPRVVRILGGNPSKYTLQGSNTYLIGQGRRRILLDTGEGKPAWKATLQTVLKDENAVIEKVILTHWHGDHVGGVSQVLELCDEKPAVYKNQPGDGQTNFEDGEVFRTEGATLRAFHCPGHTVDHMAFILEEENAMFTADNVLGHGTAVFEDLTAYMDSLTRMEKVFSGRAYPGHGAVIQDGRAKIKEYISHRKQREQDVLGVLKEKPTSGREGWDSMDAVRIIYKDYPENLHEPAHGGLKQVLKKLESDGRVKQLEDGAWQLSGKAAL